MQTEYVRNLQNNYERILLEEEPKEQRYQYCILSRGGIKGLLPFGLRRINQQVYLYYDITSKQCVGQLFCEKSITREWLRDFVWSLKRIGQELERFLLSDRNILWFPDQIYQDLEKNLFYFLYVPYLEQDNGFLKLLEFLVEHVDYEDEALVELVYKMYESYERNGETYLREKIFEDFRTFSEDQSVKKQEEISMGSTTIMQPDQVEERENTEGRALWDRKGAVIEQKKAVLEQDATEVPKKKRFGFFEHKRAKDTMFRKGYNQSMQAIMRGEALPIGNHMVAEEDVFGNEDYGKTVYIEETKDLTPHIYKLYTPEGKVLGQIDKNIVTIGKRKDEVSLCIEDMSVSRLHARITRQNDVFYLEDLNSTNGTFKNGLQLQPYEKRQLEEEDEIKIGKKVLIFR